jgi:hypothetical protein
MIHVINKQIHGWQPQSDWVDISGISDNQIGMVISDGGLLKCAFIVTTTGSVQYTVNWGDGTTNNVASGSKAEHTYTKGTGKSCSEGYTTFKCVISSAANITRFYATTHTTALTTNSRANILYTKMTTTALTSLLNAFLYVRALEKLILPGTLDYVTSITQLVSGCFNLKEIDLPSSLPLCTSANDVFNSASSIKRIIFPSMPLNTTLLNFVANCYTLEYLEFTGEMNACTTIQAMCSYARSLQKLVLPSSMSGVTVMTNFIRECATLIDIENLENVGTSTITVSTFSAPSVEQMLSISVPQKLNQFSWTAASSSIPNLLNSLRLTNATSTYTGSSPQIDIYYCSLDATALNTLFGDLPTVSASQVIRITGNPGVATCDQTIATAKGWTVNSTT